MTTLHNTMHSTKGYKVIVEADGDERREHRRHDMEPMEVSVHRWDGARRTAQMFGRIVDLSAGGVRIRTSLHNIRPDNQIRLRMELPVYAGICPFIDRHAGTAKPKREWIGWMTVSRVQTLGNGEFEVAGRLVDMDEMDRGMLGLYLSTQPMAA